MSGNTRDVISNAIPTGDAVKADALIDLHCHILPGMDDGATGLEISVEMARASVTNGVSIIACTPHILPGLYLNTGPKIRSATAELQKALTDRGIPLQLVTGADNHMVMDFLDQLGRGELLSLADSRYVLVEPPHHVVPPRLEDFFFNLMLAKYVPILTHPERLTWINSHYQTIQSLVQAGVWMQITAGSLTGNFGRNARYWAERMLDEGFVHLLATDAHDLDRRAPNLGEAREVAAKRMGWLEAQHLVFTRPRGVIHNELPANLPVPPGLAGECLVESAGDANSPHFPDNRNERGVAGRLRRFFSANH